jgi:hypothetical protein
MADISAPIPVPSGQTVTLIEVINDPAGPAGLTMRFRFLAPGIAGEVDFETAAADMLALCTGYALPKVPNPGPQPAQIVISLHDRVLPFGEAAPEAVQYFEAYRIEDGACVWDMF